MELIQAGDSVTFNCQGFLKNGMAIDLKEDKEPFLLKAGKVSSNPLQQKISQALIGMQTNQSKDLLIRPQDAFGEHDPRLVLQVARRELPPKAQEGDSFPVQVNVDGKASTKEALLVDLDEEVATLDLNHPFAGQEMTFKISIISFNR